MVGCLPPSRRPTGELRPGPTADDRLDRGVLIVAGVVVLGAIMSIPLFSVILTNQITGSDTGGAYLGLESALTQASGAEAGALREQLDRLAGAALPELADAFASVFVVGTILVGCRLVPALFLPRQRPERPVDPAAMGH